MFKSSSLWKVNLVFQFCVINECLVFQSLSDTKSTEWYKSTYKNNTQTLQKKKKKNLKANISIAFLITVIGGMSL